MSDIQIVIVCAVLVVTGLGVAVHFHLMANFLTKAPKWIPFVLAFTSAVGGIGMIISGLFGGLLYALLFSLAANIGILSVIFALWFYGVEVSKEFARVIYFRQNRKTMLYDWEVNAVDFVEGFRDFDEEQAKQSEKTCN